MGADQVAAIRPVIAEIEAAASEGDESAYCAGFNVPGREDAWVQILRGMVNFSYPFNDDPVDRLLRMGLLTLSGTTLNEWQSGIFATFHFDERTGSREIAKFVDGLFGILLGCGDDYPVDVGITTL